LGIFTATEAAATGALYALVVAAFIYRTLTLALFFECVLNAARTTAMLLLIVVGAGVFGHMLTVLRIPQQIVELVSHLDLSVYVFLAAVTVILILLGLVLESLSIILITTPIIVPVLVHLGIDKVWYGILLTITLEMALISPPVALNLVVIKSLTKAPSTEIDKAAVPYLILMLLAIILLVAFPDIAMWLPRTISNAGQ
jgi:C4-dicarboxylate transporter DctM subunit